MCHSEVLLVDASPRRSASHPETEIQRAGNYALAHGQDQGL
jgi:hypothetical protein